MPKPRYRVSLPLEVELEPLAESDPPLWLARVRSTTVGRYDADQLRDAGVDPSRLQLPDESIGAYRARRIFEALGAASACWEDLTAAGVFQSDRAAQIGVDLLTDLGMPVPEGYTPPTPTDPDLVDLDAAPPETMFAGTEPQAADPVDEWFDRSGAPLRVGDRARWWAEDGTGHVDVTIVGRPDRPYPTRVVQVVNDAGTRMLAIAHTDLERVS